MSDAVNVNSATDGSVTRRTYLALWAFAALTRLSYLAVARPEFTLYYWQAATGVRTDGSLSMGGVRTAALEPLYPIFLAAARALVGDRPLIVQGVQALVAALGAVFLARLALALTGKKQVAVASGVLFAMYPLLVRHAVDGTESALVTLLLIAFAAQFVTMSRPRDGAAAGAWLGLAILTRSVALPLLVVAPLLAAWRRDRQVAAAMGAVALVLLAPYTIRNYLLSGATVPARGGLNLFIANNEYSAGVMAGFGPDILVPFAASQLAAEQVTDRPPTAEQERRDDVAFRRLAVASMAARPLETLRLKVVNLFLFFSPLIVPRFAVAETTSLELHESGESTILNGKARPLLDEVAYTVSYGAVVVLAVMGIYGRRRDLGNDAILWCVLLTFTAVHIVVFPSTRYRAPVEFVLLFYAGVATAALAVQIRAIPVRRAGGP